MRLVNLLPILLAVACSSSTEPPVEESQATFEEDVRWAPVGRTCDAGSPAGLLTPVQLDSLYAPEPVGDGRLAERTREVPGGFGGVFRPNGVLTMYLVDPDQRDAAVTALLALGEIPSAPDVVVKGRWSFAELYDWKRYLVMHTSPLPGWQSGDLQEAENRIIFGFTDDAAREAVENVLASLELPCFLVATRKEPLISAN